MPARGILVGSALNNYTENRENGEEQDNPSRPFPKDGTYSWQHHPNDEKDYYRVRYDEGPKDHAWMKEKDRSYLARLEREKQEQIRLAAEKKREEQLRVECEGRKGQAVLNKKKKEAQSIEPIAPVMESKENEKLRRELEEERNKRTEVEKKVKEFSISNKRLEQLLKEKDDRLIDMVQRLSVLQTQPETVKALIEQANIWLETAKETGEYNNVIEIAQKALAMHPDNDRDNIRLHYVLSQAYLKMRLFSEAEKQALSIQDYDHRAPIAYIVLAESYYLTKEFDKSMAAIMGGLRYIPENVPDGLRMMSIWYSILREKRDMESARELARRIQDALKDYFSLRDKKLVIPEDLSQAPEQLASDVLVLLSELGMPYAHSHLIGLLTETTVCWFCKFVTQKLASLKVPKEIIKEVLKDVLTNLVGIDEGLVPITEEWNRQLAEEVLAANRQLDLIIDTALNQGHLQGARIDELVRVKYGSRVVGQGANSLMLFLKTRPVKPEEKIHAKPQILRVKEMLREAALEKGLKLKVISLKIANAWIEESNISEDGAKIERNILVVTRRLLRMLAEYNNEAVNCRQISKFGIHPFSLFSRFSFANTPVNVICSSIVAHEIGEYELIKQGKDANKAHKIMMEKDSILREWVEKKLPELEQQYEVGLNSSESVNSTRIRGDGFDSGSRFRENDV